MLSYIKGFIKNIELNSVIILTDSGVGYEIIINELVYANIYDKKEIELFVYHNISENGQSLFGFIEYEDRVLFKELIKISGIGGKVGQAILSLGTARLKKAILEEDNKTLESIKGVGKKMAEKIILELKDKDFIINSSFTTEIENRQNKNTQNIKSDLKSEIISTLTIMGYNSRKVDEMLNNLPEGLNNLENIIPYIIKNI